MRRPYISPCYMNNVCHDDDDTDQTHDVSCAIDTHSDVNDDPGGISILEPLWRHFDLHFYKWNHQLNHPIIVNENGSSFTYQVVNSSEFLRVPFQFPKRGFNVHLTILIFDSDLNTSCRKVHFRNGIPVGDITCHVA